MRVFTRITQKLSLLLSFIVFTSSAVSAHGAGCACTALRPQTTGGPIITIPAYTMPKGTFSIGYGINFLNNKRLGSSAIRRVLASDEHADDNYGSLNQSLSAAYGITDDLNVFVTLPFNMAFNFREVHDGVEDLGDSIGFGDLTILSQYRVFKSDKTNISILGGIRLPTGKTHVRSDTGETFEALNNPGSGSFDPLFGVAVSRPFGRLGVDFNFLYKLSTKGSQDTILGDVANYNLAFSYAVNHNHEDAFTHEHDHKAPEVKKDILEKIFPQHFLGQHLAWDLILEVNANWEEKPEENGIRDNNHGGTTVFLSPGFRTTINNRYVFNMGIGFPIIENLNGEQGGTDLQLYSGFAMSL